MRPDPRGRLRRAVAVAAILLAAAGCQAPSADGESPAYEPRLQGGGEPLLYHWPLGTTVRVYVDPAGAPQGLDLAAAARRGADAWRAGLYYRDVSFAFVQDPLEANVLVRWEEADPVVQSLACVSANGFAAVTNFCIPDGSTFQALPYVPPDDGRPSVAYFDVVVSTDRITIPDQTRLEGIVAHEIGHTLGIGTHSNEPADLMFSGVGANAPTPRDLRTLRWVMHQPSQIALPAPATP